MRNFLFPICISMSLMLMGFANKLEPSYYNGDLKSAKSIAKTENKFVFVKFYANWCVPCKWMDETTYSDPTVINKIDDNFISMKVNIDDFDGFSLRQKLEVSVLPTVIIYNPEGKMVKRIEETLPSSKMINLLDDVIQNNGGSVKTVKNKSPRPTTKPVQNAAVGKKIYKLQLGVFNGFENTMEFLDAIKEMVDEQAIVLHDYKEGKTIYKVLIGRYKSKVDAVKAKEKLKSQHGLDSVVF